MSDQNKIKALIDDMRETAYVDFKRDFYKPLKASDFPKDIASFANSPLLGDKFLIFGVEDKTRCVVGIDPTTIPTQDEIDGYLHRVLEPFVEVEIGVVDYDAAYKVCFVRIAASNNNPPYTIKETCGPNNKIEKGDVYIRKGTCNQKAGRKDIDEMYLRNGQFILKLHENFVVVGEHGCEGKIVPNQPYGQIAIEMGNLSQFPKLITDGLVKICLSNGRCLEKALVAIEGNHPIRENPFMLPQNSRKVYQALFQFNSDDCVFLGFTEYGELLSDATMQIFLQDTDGFVYESEETSCTLLAKGNILHKIPRSRGRFRF